MPEGLAPSTTISPTKTPHYYRSLCLSPDAESTPTCALSSLLGLILKEIGPILLFVYIIIIIINILW